MTHSTVRRRSRVARTAGVLAAAALAGSGIVATSTAAFAEESAAADIPSLQTFDAESFNLEADALPGDLQAAIERDLELTPAQYLANAEASKVAAQAVAALRDADVSVNNASFNADDQSLTVYVEAEADIAAVEAIGAKAEIGVGPQPDGELEAIAYADFKGGYGLMNPTEGRCSAGFNSYNAAGDPAILLAGHCNPENGDYTWYEFAVDEPMSPNNPAPWPQGPAVGAGGEFQFGDDHDAGLFPVSNTTDWTYPAATSTWGAGGVGNPEEGQVVIRDHVDPLVGQQVCRSGASSGYHCGDVTFVDQQVNVEGNMVTGVITNACATQGDSGGSYVVGSSALGVLSAGNYTAPDHPAAPCDDWDPSAHFTLAYAVSGSEFSAQQFYGDDFELKVSIATPEVTAPGATSGPTPTFKGTVAGGSANYTATVTIDGGTEYSAAVAAGGAINIPVTEALEVGPHTYELVVDYGRFSSSEVVTGAFTVVENPVEDLTVEAPSNGQTTPNPRPAFNGTGEPGADVALTVGDKGYGSAKVGDDGAWTIEPSEDLPIATRFDAVVTQKFEDDEQSVTVSDLGVKAQAVTITVPEDGSEVPTDVVFEGTAQPGSEVSLTLAPAEEAADATSLTALSADVSTMDEDDAAPADTWEGEFTFEGNTWTFTPAEDIPTGEWTFTATATIGTDADLGTSTATSTFTAVEAGGDAGGDGGDLPDTGSSTTPLIIGAILLVLAGGAALVTVRTRRNGSAA